MVEIVPEEVRRMIEEFEAEEARRTTGLTGEKSVSKRSLRLERRRSRRVWRSGELEGLATEYGLDVEVGGGRHGRHIVGLDGSCCPLPDHRGHLPIGTARGIVKWIISASSPK